MGARAFAAHCRSPAPLSPTPSREACRSTALATARSLRSLEQVSRQHGRERPWLGLSDTIARLHAEMVAKRRKQQAAQTQMKSVEYVI